MARCPDRRAVNIPRYSHPLVPPEQLPRLRRCPQRDRTRRHPRVIEGKPWLPPTARDQLTPSPDTDQRRMAAQGDQRPLPPAPPEGRLTTQHELRATPADRRTAIPRLGYWPPGPWRYAQRRCDCAAEHGGSGRYVFLGADGGHHREEQLRATDVPPGPRRAYRPANARARHAGRRGRYGRPGMPVASWPPRGARKGVRSPVWPGTPRLILGTDRTGRCRLGRAVRLRLDGKDDRPQDGMPATAPATGSSPPTMRRWPAGWRSRTG